MKPVSFLTFRFTYACYFLSNLRLECSEMTLVADPYSLTGAEACSLIYHNE